MTVYENFFTMKISSRMISSRISARMKISRMDEDFTDEDFSLIIFLLNFNYFFFYF